MAKAATATAPRHSGALARVRSDAAIEKAKQATRATLARGKAQIEKRQHTMAMAVVCAGIGYYEKSGKQLPSFIDGVPTKVQLAVLAAVVADNTTGQTQKYAQSLCDGMVALTAYNFGKGQDIGDDGGADDEVDV